MVIRFLMSLLVAVFAGSAFAGQVVDATDRMEINWSTLKIRFYGEAVLNDSDSDAYKSAERKAWHDGLTYASEAVRNLNVSVNEGLVASPDKLTEDARKAAKQVSTSTSSYNTTYFGDGHVRVHLESTLPKALETSGIRFRQKDPSEPAMTQFTGIVLKADKATKPKPIYQVVDESGAVVFDVKDMAEEAYRKNLMGRWFKRPTAGELGEAAGKNPVQLEAEVQDGRFVVSRASWDKALEGHRSLLVNGLVVIALP